MTNSSIEQLWCRITAVEDEIKRIEEAFDSQRRVDQKWKDYSEACYKASLIQKAKS